SVAFMKCAEALFLFSGGLTLAYMTKIFVCIFLEDNPYGAPKAVRKGPYMSKLMAVILGVIAIALPVLGIFPHQTQNTLADMCAHFMNAHTPDHAVNYFAWLNLKGAVISICVGVVVYFLFIRKVLMRKDENGNVVYVDCWPEWCNIEDKIYRPLLLGVLPYIGGFFARIAGNLLDGFISVLSMLIFNDDNGRVVPPEDKYFSAYTDYEADHEMYREGFAQSLLLIGIGLTIAVIYIIV
ncbi:MAG: sodium:proton antiporter, partial [Anaerotignum sp.]|nr:sodium:proton antiporter [Anaerotignum sp.]